MARPRRDVQSPEPEMPAPEQFRWLSTLLMNSEPDTLAHLLWRRIHQRADEIARRGGSDERQLAELWEFIDELGLREAGERLIRYLVESRERWKKWAA